MTTPRMPDDNLDRAAVVRLVLAGADLGASLDAIDMLALQIADAIQQAEQDWLVETRPRCIAEARERMYQQFRQMSDDIRRRLDGEAS